MGIKKRKFSILCIVTANGQWQRKGFTFSKVPTKRDTAISPSTNLPPSGIRKSWQFSGPWTVSRFPPTAGQFFTRSLTNLAVSSCWSRTSGRRTFRDLTCVRDPAFRDTVFSGTGSVRALASPHTGVFGRYCLIRSAGRRARCLDCVVHSCRHDRGPHRCHWSAILVRSRTSPEQHKVLGEVWAFCSVAGAMRGSICERTRYSGRQLDELEDQLSFRGSRIYHFAACDSQLA